MPDLRLGLSTHFVLIPAYINVLRKITDYHYDNRSQNSVNCNSLVSKVFL